MKRQSAAAICLSSIVLAACQNAEETSSQQAATASRTPQTTTQASLLSEPNWVLLFAGHDLSSFDQVGDAQWNITDDYVEADGYTQAYLVTRGHYSDFLLHVEFWPGPGANSGYSSATTTRTRSAPTAGTRSISSIRTKNPDNRTGSIVNHMPPIAAISTEGQWNTYEINAEGNRIVVRLNGTVTAEFESEEHASGPIAFQNNGGLIRFRNIRLRPL